ncbi:MAG: phospholipase A [Desulfobacterales bacterium]|nr:phospholipase A [Desulfobacterales bacterium]
MCYLKPGALIETGAQSYFTISPRAWAYVGDLNDNPDIDRYRGHFDMEMAWELKNSWKVAAILGKGNGAGKGSAQFDATYPIGEILRGNLDVYLHLQYYTGYAEILRSYDESYNFFRIGFAMFR